MTAPTFSFELIWSKEDFASAEDATWGYLSFQLGQDRLWVHPERETRGAYWTWVDLLEHLAAVWPWLALEEGWPAGPQLRDARDFLQESRLWLQGLSAADADHKEDELLEYRQRHDLAMAVRGKLLPQLWIVREGQEAWVVGETAKARIPWPVAESALLTLGEKIVARLARVTDERAIGAIEAWKARMDLSSTSLAAISVGLDDAKLLDLVQGDLGLLEIDANVPMNDANELLAVARMAVPSTDPAIVRTILGALRASKKGSTSKLEPLSAKAQVESVNGSAANQGYELARFFRAERGLGAEQRVEPAELLSDLGVTVVDLKLDDAGIEAVASWGPSHGPVVLINSQGRHSQDANGRRATLAHELAHLLADRATALPLAEVLGGHMPREVEQRANAFAAELLLPQAVAGAAFANSEDPRAVLANLSNKYGASREIVAWQAYNSAIPMSWPTFLVLREQVSRPERFAWAQASRR